MKCFHTFFFVAALTGIVVLSGCGTTTGNALSSGDSSVEVTAGVGSPAQQMMALVQGAKLAPSPSFSLKLCPTAVTFQTGSGTAAGTEGTLTAKLVDLGTGTADLGQVTIAALTYTQATVTLGTECGTSLTYDDATYGKHVSSSQSLTLQFEGTFDLTAASSVVYFDLFAIKAALDADPDPGADLENILKNHPGGGKGHGNTDGKTNGNGNGHG